MEGERNEGERGGEKEGEICHKLVKIVKQKGVCGQEMNIEHQL